MESEFLIYLYFPAHEVPYEFSIPVRLCNFQNLGRAFGRSLPFSSWIKILVRRIENYPLMSVGHVVSNVAQMAAVFVVCGMYVCFAEESV